MHYAGVQTALYVEHRYNPIHRRYEYDPACELVRTLDKLRGETRHSYQASGQLRSRNTGSILSSEEFRYNAAGNRLDFNARQFARVTDNRTAKWRHCKYRYDAWVTRSRSSRDLLLSSGLGKIARIGWSE